jgi:hypothetical protein
MIDLLPCPFCGGAPLRCSNVAYFPMHWVLCRVCHASPGDRGSPLEAAAAWNSRAAWAAAVAPDKGRACRQREAVAWLYEKRCVQSLQFNRQEWLTSSARGWTETPLYADPAPLDCAERLEAGQRIDPTDRVPLGLYRIHWKTGGSSLAAVGMDHSGARWMAPTNWTCAEIKAPAAPLVGHPWAEVEYLEPLSAEATKGAGAR